MAIPFRLHVDSHVDCVILDSFLTRISKVLSLSLTLVTILLTVLSRWLIANHRRTDAIEILKKLRGDLHEDDPLLVEEIAQLDAIVVDSGHKRNSYVNILLGGRHSGSLHLGRRALMGAALQTIQQWTGILAIVSKWSDFQFLRDLLIAPGNMGNAAVRLGRFRSIQIKLACWSDQHLWNLRYCVSSACN